MMIIDRMITMILKAVVDEYECITHITQTVPKNVAALTALSLFRVQNRPSLFYFYYCFQLFVNYKYADNIKKSSTANFYS